MHSTSDAPAAVESRLGDPADMTATERGHHNYALRQDLGRGRMRAVILCSSSFLSDGPRPGLQFIAQGMAREGWDVRYISAPSSLFDFPLHSKRGRFHRAWLQNRSHDPVQIEPNLREYIFRSPVPVDRRFLRYPWQVAHYRSMAPRWLREERFDLCIHDSSPALLYRPLVRAQHHILRLSDTIEGFSHFGPPVVNAFHEGLRAGAYSAAWAVTHGLLEYGRERQPNLPGVIIPNGVEVERFIPQRTAHRQPNSAVYIGSRGTWVDLELLAAAARRLPAWHFDIYGPLRPTPSTSAPNVKFHGRVPYHAVPEILSAYQVGLIPFRDVCGRLLVCERPLKFYQYLAAGLGVAATDVGGLRAGMGPWAHFGNDADHFAQAIVTSRASAAGRDQAATRRFVESHSWSSRLRDVKRSLAAFFPSAYAAAISHTVSFVPA